MYRRCIISNTRAAGGFSVHNFSICITIDDDYLNEEGAHPRGYNPLDDWSRRTVAFMELISAYTTRGIFNWVSNHIYRADTVYVLLFFFHTSHSS